MLERFIDASPVVIVAFANVHLYARHPSNIEPLLKASPQRHQQQRPSPQLHQERMRFPHR
jgi:hypothetical protein